MIHFMRRSQLQHSLLNESLNCRIKKYLTYVTTDIPIMFMWLVVTSLRIIPILWFIIILCNQAKAPIHVPIMPHQVFSVTIYHWDVILFPIYLLINHGPNPPLLSFFPTPAELIWREMIRNGLTTKNAMNINLKVFGIRCSFKNFPYNYTRKNLYKKENM